MRQLTLFMCLVLAALNSTAQSTRPSATFLQNQDITDMLRDQQYQYGQSCTDKIPSVPKTVGINPVAWIKPHIPTPVLNQGTRSAGTRQTILFTPRGNTHLITTIRIQ